MYNELGEKTNIIIAAKHNELYGLWWRCNIRDRRNIDAIITARVTDGEKPVINAYAHNKVIVMINLNFRRPTRSMGYSNIAINNVIIPT